MNGSGDWGGTSSGGAEGVCASGFGRGALAYSSGSAKVCSLEVPLFLRGFLRGSFSSLSFNGELPVPTPKFIGACL